MTSPGSDWCGSVSEVGSIRCVDEYELRFSATDVATQCGAVPGSVSNFLAFQLGSGILGKPDGAR